MEENKKKSKLIIILISLLTVSILAIGSVVIRNYIRSSSNNTVTIPDNIIDPEKEVSKDKENQVDKPISTELNTDKQDIYIPVIADKETVDISLHNKNNSENVPFKVGNMLPGDKETKYFRLKVSYENDITVRFSSNIHPGSDKLAEVLKCKVTLLSSGKVMYDGLMKDMPKFLNYKLNTVNHTTEELYYEITTYIDTSIGNEYMNKILKADFCWWIEEKGNLRPAPKPSQK